jgi:hypothetical protein
MAQLWDQRRFFRSTEGFNGMVQLPLMSDLPPDWRVLLAVAEVGELTAWFSRLGRAAKELEVSAGPIKHLLVEQQLKASASPSSTAAEQPQETADAKPYSAMDLLGKVQILHYAILELHAADSASLSAYHLGIALSDLCWKPYIAPPGTVGENVAETFFKGLERTKITELQMLLRAATYELPRLAAATVSRSLENWRDWADVNAVRLANSPSLWPNVLGTLRVQGDIWRQLLTTETVPEDDADQGPAVLASLRRLRPILGVAVLTAIALYLTITNFNGAAKVWTTLGTIAAALGVTGVSLASAARKAANAFGWSQQTTAKAEARVWSVTLLPAITLSAATRYRLNRRDVHLSRLRVNLDEVGKA